MFSIRASIAQTVFCQHLLLIRFHVQAAESELVLSLLAVYCSRHFLASWRSMVTDLTTRYCGLFYSIFFCTALCAHVITLRFSAAIEHSLSICISVQASYGILKSIRKIVCVDSRMKMIDLMTQTRLARRFLLGQVDVCLLATFEEVSARQIITLHYTQEQRYATL